MAGARSTVMAAARPGAERGRHLWSVYCSRERDVGPGVDLPSDRARHDSGPIRRIGGRHVWAGVSLCTHI